jgi:hypothetical protein
MQEMSSVNRISSCVCAVVASMCLVLAATPLKAEPFEGLQQVYHATFGNGSLGSGVDHLSLGELKPGNAQVADSDPIWVAEQGTIRVAVTRPAVQVVGPVASGLFATPVDFGQGTIVGLRATFVAPSGPHDSGNIWAVTLGVRTGSNHDLAAEVRTATTFQVRGSGARLNVVGSQAPANQLNVPQEIYDAIFNPIDPQPFTLELLLDRRTGNSVARLIVDDSVFEHGFQSATFRPDAGPAITAVGPTIAISNAPGSRASVRIADFSIFTTKVGNPNELGDPCPAELGCREWP